MENIVNIIIERGSGRSCECIDSLYEEPDPNCKACLGAGVVITRTRRLVKASMEPSGEIADEGDPIIYACMFECDVVVDDVIIYEGKRYMVIEIAGGFALDNRDIIICGLDYERSYNHSETDLKRYK